MGYAKRRTLQQLDLWSDRDDDCIRWDWSQIARAQVPDYRKHDLHLLKFANRFENRAVHFVQPVYNCSHGSIDQGLAGQLVPRKGNWLASFIIVKGALYVTDLCTVGIGQLH